MIYINNLKLIDASEVPPVRKGPPLEKKWNNLFDSIPKGKAAVFDLRLYGNIHHALVIRHKHGLYRSIYVSKINGKIYVINPSNG